LNPPSILLIYGYIFCFLFLFLKLLEAVSGIPSLRGSFGTRTFLFDIPLLNIYMTDVAGSVPSFFYFASSS
jgi:hypothetical protein